MRERFQLPIPMWRVQFQLAGGFRKQLGVAVAYLAAWMIGLFGLRHLIGDETTTADFAAGSLMAITGIQLLIVVIGGCNAVQRATLRDYTTKMIESHRLSPMPNVTAVVGYLFGATIQVQILFAINVLIGMPLTLLAGYPLDGWLYGNAIALNGALTLWAITVFAGMGTRKPISPAGVIVLVSIVANAALFLLPAAGLFFSAYATMLGGMAMIGEGTMSAAQFILIGSASAVLTAFWLMVAATKYRRPDLPAFNALRGSLLLLLWLIFGTVGLVAIESGMNLGTPGRIPSEMLATQWIATMVLALPLTAVTLNGAVQHTMAMRRGADARDRWDRVSSLTIALMSALVICSVMAGIGYNVWQTLVSTEARVMAAEFCVAWIWELTFAACALGLLTIRGVLHFFGSFSRSPKILSTVCIGVLWVVPPGIDLVMAASDQVLVMSWLLAASPPGALVALWGPANVPLLPGFIAQSVLMVLVSMIAWRLQARRIPPSAA